MAEAQRSARARPLEAQVAFGLAPRDLQKKTWPWFQLGYAARTGLEWFG
jgi:hypothetical protein